MHATVEPLILPALNLAICPMKYFGALNLDVFNGWTRLLLK